jgi:hypothetical protein
MSAATPLGAVGLPDATVVELSIVVALLGRGPVRLECLAPVLAAWFARSVDWRALAPSVRRMKRRGWLIADRVGALTPTGSGRASAQLLYAGVIRMVGATERARSSAGKEGSEE